MPWWRRRTTWTTKLVGVKPPTLDEAARYADAIQWTDIQAARQQQILHTNRRYYLHIISPYHQPDSGNVQQEKVMASIDVARVWVQRILPDVQVAVVTFDGRNSSVRRPTFFDASTTTLNHSVFEQLARSHNVDTASFGGRRLPLLRDVLEAAMSDLRPFTHLIYTNMDIFVMPHFYAAVDSMVTCGLQSFFFNR